MQTANTNEWFASWFDSPYYHQLYSNRDDNEAEGFLTRLTAHLSLPKTVHILDLACGAGRHSRVLHQLGYRVTGCDLSPNSILEAQEKAADGMSFFVHDMRNPLPDTYDVALNLFTSFGYFDHVEDNSRVLDSIYNGLSENGLLVIDFMNAEKVIRELKPRQEINREGIIFHIKREVSNGKIVKTIAFEAENQSHFYQEKVQALDLIDFQQLLGKAQFEIINVLGNYSLESYNPINSDRLILICKKQ